jgi:hypothetical protein
MLEALIRNFASISVKRKNSKNHLSARISDKNPGAFFLLAEIRQTVTTFSHEISGIVWNEGDFRRRFAMSEDKNKKSITIINKK